MLCFLTVVVGVGQDEKRAQIKDPFFFVLRNGSTWHLGNDYYFAVIVEAETNSFDRHVEWILGGDRSMRKGFRSGFKSPKKEQKFQVFYILPCQ